MVLMCGVIGFYSKNVTIKQMDLLKRLMQESSIRGTHSFGVAYNGVDGFKINKSFNLDFKTLFDGYEKSRNNFLIFHNRYCTSGDYLEMQNNQPILGDDACLAMNGVISMKTKSEFEKDFNVKCRSDNDTEIILNVKISQIEFLKQNLNISFAGVFLYHDRLVALRNDKRPLYMFDYLEAVYICSTKDIAKRCGIDNVKEIPSYKEVIINE
jgi:glucosamine 6-phosphate synthetase-like amidotransferase/phosphosugar isomerase protein